MMEELMFHLW